MRPAAGEKLFFFNTLTDFLDRSSILYPVNGSPPYIWPDLEPVDQPQC